MTKLIVAQRISTIMNADLILMWIKESWDKVPTGTLANEVYQEIAYSQLSKEELEHKNKRKMSLKQSKPYLAGLSLPF